MQKLLVLGVIFFIGFTLHAQKKKENVFLHPDKFYEKYFPHLKIKYNPSDSTYIKVYPKNYATVATHVFSPTVHINIEPKGALQASSQFRTNIKTITGFSFSYRHITAGFAMSLLPPVGDPPGYVSTKYRTATIKYKSPIYILTFKFMKVQGMTDINSFNSLDPLQSTVPRPDITIKEYMFEGIYNFNWKKYSYLSTVDHTEGQIKSHLGFMVKAGIYSQRFYGDTNLLSVPQRPYFEGYDNITKVVGYNIKLSPGIGGNLVIKKHFYATISIFSPLNLYINRLYSENDERVHKETSLQWVLDGSASIGYQSNRFFAAVRFDLDGRTAALNTVRYTSAYNYIGFDIGYRFVAPRVVKKVYDQTMPPGL
ncbi:DUF4421 domain-containing protein [Cytophaga aurantiaca]|uniref:DUF4421 domain-containing protein n=1 Tax=Cytophaga aurantiaca TaxID=29530 RepID=UPI00037E2925|nr:DUF4421 domain-containing protein [Cytophaga aurantiaca]